MLLRCGAVMLRGEEKEQEENAEEVEEEEVEEVVVTILNDVVVGIVVDFASCLSSFSLSLMSLAVVVVVNLTPML